MIRFVICVLFASLSLQAAEPYQLKAPDGWGGETIQLPPGFAKDMSLKGVEHIRFAPGMMKAQSDTFFCYAFVFELQAKPELSEQVVSNELLKYYRGLCRAVMGQQIGEVDPATFSIKLKSKTESDREYDQDVFVGSLDWVEPFATKKPQKLQLEIWVVNRKDKGNLLFACVSPRPLDAKIWNQLRQIRLGYFKSKHR